MVEMNRDEVLSKVPVIGFSFLCGIFFLIFIIFWSQVAYAFGAAWYSLLISMLCFFIARNIVVHPDLGLTKKTDVSRTYVLFTAWNVFITFCAAVVVSVNPPPNGADSVLKPIFVFVTIVALLCFLAFLQAPTYPTEDEKNVLAPAERSNNLNGSTEDREEAETSSCKCCTQSRRNCCHSCCLYFLLVLITFAAFYIFAQNARDERYLENPNRVFVQSSNSDPNILTDFRCEGEGEPLVLLFHGYGGQALDFQHVVDQVQEETTVCAFSRQGYGLSREFSPLRRVSENFASELNVALGNLDIEANKFENVIVAGHSMGGFNMRAYDRSFPNRIAAMVMIDPVAPEFTDDCEIGGININSLSNEIIMRFADTGLLLPLEALGIQNVVAATDALPERVHREYAANLYRTEYGFTATEEGKNWGETCAFVANHTADYPVTVLIPEQGIYLGESFSEVDKIKDFSTNEASRTIFQPGENAGHTEAVFDIFFVQDAIDEILRYVEQVRNNEI